MKLLEKSHRERSGALDDTTGWFQISSAIGENDGSRPKSLAATKNRIIKSFGFSE